MDKTIKMAISIDYKSLERNFGKNFGKVGARPTSNKLATETTSTVTSGTTTTVTTTTTYTTATTDPFKVYAYKFGYNYNKDKLKASLKYSGVYFDENTMLEYKYRNYTLGESGSAAINWIKDSFNVNTTYKFSDKIELYGEFGFLTLLDGFVKYGYIADGEKEINDAYAIATKATYNFSNKFRTYILGKYVQDGFLSDSDMEDYNRNVNKIRTGGVTTLESETSYDLNKNLKVAGSIKYKIAGENIFNKNKNDLEIKTRLSCSF